MALRVRSKRDATGHTSGRRHGRTRRALRSVFGYLHASTFTLIHLYFLYSLVSPFMECVPPRAQGLPSSRAELYHKAATFYGCAQLTATQVVPRIFFKEVVFRWKRGRTLAEAASNVWGKPSSALMLFGMAYFALRGFLWTERVLWYSLRGTVYALVWIGGEVCAGLGKLRRCRARSMTEEGQDKRKSNEAGSSNGRKEEVVGHAQSRWRRLLSPFRCCDDDVSPDSAAVQLTLFRLLRKGNGYDTVLRLGLTACELVWLMQQIRLHHTLTSAAQQLSPAPAPPATWVSTHLLLRLYLPSRLRTLTGLHVVVTILFLTALLDVKRAFNLLIGVRPLWLINGWDCCPLCTEMWRHGSSRVHRCPRLFLPPAVHRPSLVSHKTAHVTKEAKQEEKAEEDRLTVLPPRPGNVFPDPDKVSKLSVFNYNWVNSLLNVALISAFGDFGPPPSDRYPDGGSQLWKAQRAVVRRLPPLPREFQTARSIDAPAWYLWRHRYEYGATHRSDGTHMVKDEEGVALRAAGLLPRQGIVERGILYVTAPLRRVLVHAFALFFLPSKGKAEGDAATVADSTSSQDTTVTSDSNNTSRLRRWMSWRTRRASSRKLSATQEQRTKTNAEVQPRKAAGLFQLFLEHPSGREYIWTCVPMKLMQDAASIAAPTVVRSLVVFLREVSLRSTEHPREQLGRGLLICLVLTLVILAQSVIFQAYLRHLYGASMKASSALKCLVLHHTLQTPIAYACRSEAAPKTTKSEVATTPAVGAAAVEQAGSSEQRRKGQGLTISTGTNSVVGSARSEALEKRGSKAEGASRRPSLEKAPPTVCSPNAASAPAGSKDASAGNNSLMSHEGQVVTLLTVDCTNCGDCLVFLHNVWGHPVIILSSLFTMYRYVGWFATLTTFTVVAALTPLNRYFSSRVRIAQQGARNNTARISDLTSALPSMRTVKGMALESSIVERIERARAEESEGATRVGRAESVAVAQTEVMTLLISLVCCGSYLLSGGTMDAAVLVPTMAALNVMRFPLWTLPHVFSQVSRGYLSMKRIERYLNQDRECVEHSYAQDNHSEAEACEGREADTEKTNGATAAEKTRIEGKTTNGRAGNASTINNNNNHHVRAASTAAAALPKGTILCAGDSFAWSAQDALHHEPSSPLRACVHNNGNSSGSNNNNGNTNGNAAAASSCSAAFGEANAHAVVSSARRRSSATRRQSSDSAALAMSLHSPNWANNNNINNNTTTSSSSVVLHQVALHIAPGEFVVVRGPTGSGKSALLLAMLGELYPLPQCRPDILHGPHSLSSTLVNEEEEEKGEGGHGGDVSKRTEAAEQAHTQDKAEGSQDAHHHHHHKKEQEEEEEDGVVDEAGEARETMYSSRGFVLAGRVAFCGEYPWLRNQTIRENIRQRPDEWPETAAEAAWYNKVLFACALREDLAAMPRADRSIVGENGAKLSGGQRARVALARAVYALPHCDIFLLDDVLSALDVEVQRHLVTHLFHGLLRSHEEEKEEEVSKETSVAAEAAASHSPSPDPHVTASEVQELHGHGVTIVLSTHVATELLLPDRVLELQTDGTVRELPVAEHTEPAMAHESKVHHNSSSGGVAGDESGRRKSSKDSDKEARGDKRTNTATTTTQPNEGSDEEVEENEMSCSVSSPHSPCTSAGAASGTEAEKASNEPTAQRRRRRRGRRGPRTRKASRGPVAAGREATQQKANGALSTTTTTHTMNSSSSSNSSSSVVRFSLFPHKEDLMVLFYDYMGVAGVALVILTSLLMQTFRTFMDNWLGFWFSLHSTEAEKEIMKSRPVQHLKDLWLALRDGANVMQALWAVSRPAPPPPPPPPPPRGLLPWMRLHLLSSDDEDMVRPFLVTYACIGILSAVFSFVRSRVFFRAYHRVANELHRHVIQRLFRAPVSYYDRVPSSTLLQVLSRDQQVVDHMLGQSIELVLLTIIQLVAVICFNALRYAAFIVVLPITAYLFYQLTMRFLVLIKQVRALEGKLSAQVVQVVKEALQGAVTIRAYGADTVRHIQSEMFDALDSLHTAAYICLTADRWVALRLELVSLAMTSTLSILAVLTACLKKREGHYRTAQLEEEAVSAEAVFAGLGIVSSITAARSLSLLCRRIGMFQNEFVSAESLLRLLREVPQEEAAASPAPAPAPAEEDEEPPCIAGTPRAELPLLDVRHLSAKYQPHLSYVLRDVSFTLSAGECVGLIGRTGNGKSSVFNALLQLMDCIEGEVRIPRAALLDSNTSGSDDETVDALRSDVYALRRRYFQIVTQEPFLLQGTCRSNLQLGMASAHTTSTSTDNNINSISDEASPAALPSADRLLLEVLHKVSLDELLLSAWCGSPSVASPTQAHFPAATTAAAASSSSSSSASLSASVAEVTSVAAAEKPKNENTASVTEGHRDSHEEGTQSEATNGAAAAAAINAHDQASKTHDEGEDHTTRPQSAALAAVLPLPAEEKGVRTSVEDVVNVSASNTVSGTEGNAASKEKEDEEAATQREEDNREEEDKSKSAARQDSSSSSSNNNNNNIAEDEDDDEAARASVLLDHVIMAGGANLSAGQRQLLCLARALLHRPRVVLLDEVSSRVDARTEMVIQKVIEEEFLQRKDAAKLSTTTTTTAMRSARGPCGVLLIAHRLETIMALCDRVLVIDHGRVAACLTKEQVSTLEDLQSYL